MTSLKFCMVFFSGFLCLLIFLSITSTSAANPTYLYNGCSSTNFTRNGTYQANLNRLLTSLPSKANRSSKGFYNATSGQDPNKVYSLFLCRGDVTAATCQDCVTFATTDATQRCPDAKEITIWYDECLLRYSDSLIFSTLAYKPFIETRNTVDMTEPERFNELLGSSMTLAAIQAANSPAKFSTREAKFNSVQTLYCLVQCTPDLSSSDCNRCLNNSISGLPSPKKGGRMLYPSCYSRYEFYPFYNESLIATPPVVGSPPPPAGCITRPKGERGISSSIAIAIVAPIAVAVLLFISGCCFLGMRARRASNAIQQEIAGDDITTVEFLKFDFGTIEAATNKFSTDNKLGEGGFGEVYKGVLPNGQEIVVKRLTKNLKQGAEVFKNEVVSLAKLYHKNLVRLLGFCLEGDEKILIYEFMTNKSLDYFLYVPEKQRELNWSKRYNIIGGIARGIFYLHEDSQQKIIHRDLKASNILLDGDMNPKVSDFGIARILKADQTQGNTSKAVGTRGYMTPEYAISGRFSMKSDVYSFGVLVLEIITGKKNSAFDQIDGVEDLLSYAWKHWIEETPMQLLDSALTDSYSRNEVTRCIHLGLLCVQEDPAARPTMATVVLMLNSYSITLPNNMHFSLVREQS